ncbi:MAG: ABC transporter permease [Paracoccus sp. (in: a-proteobacteria)]|nr:ABC transporter permease [Paracoccus sp. (in: a-proteobacteria)]
MNTKKMGRPVVVENVSLPETTWSEDVAFIDRIPRSVAMIGLLAIALTIWWAIHHFQIVSRIILPSPQEVARDIVFVAKNMASGGYMLAAFWITTKEVLFGFAFAMLFGFTLGIIVGETSFGERALLPYLVAIDTMPKVAFAPLFLAWLGFGIASKVALAAFIATFPIVVGTAAGLHASDENARMMFKSLGASRWQTLVRLKIPSGLPHIFTGLKIGAVGVMAGAITAEFLGGGKGMGELIRVAASQLQTPRIFSLILYLSALGYLLFWSVVILERKIVFWHRSSVAGIDSRQ